MKTFDVLPPRSGSARLLQANFPGLRRTQAPLALAIAAVLCAPSMAHARDYTDPLGRAVAFYDGDTVKVEGDGIAAVWLSGGTHSTSTGSLLIRTRGRHAAGLF